MNDITVSLKVLATGANVTADFRKVVACSMHYTHIKAKLRTASFSFDSDGDVVIESFAMTRFRFDRVRAGYGWDSGSFVWVELAPGLLTACKVLDDRSVLW